MAKRTHSTPSKLVADYLRALRQYTCELRVPGLDRSSPPLPFDDVFVELALIAAQPVNLPPRDFGAATTSPPSADDEASPLPAAEPAGAILARELALVLLGEPGDGKSTLLRHHAGRMADDRRLLPPSPKASI
jgi:hypothetical protein